MHQSNDTLINPFPRIQYIIHKSPHMPTASHLAIPKHCLRNTR
jgi:hypothetical protein